MNNDFQYTKWFYNNNKNVGTVYEKGYDIKPFDMFSNQKTYKHGTNLLTIKRSGNKFYVIRLISKKDNNSNVNDGLTCINDIHLFNYYNLKTYSKINECIVRIGKRNYRLYLTDHELNNLNLLAKMKS